MSVVKVTDSRCWDYWAAPRVRKKAYGELRPETLSPKPSTLDPKKLEMLASNVDSSTGF